MTHTTSACHPTESGTSPAISGTCQAGEGTYFPPSNTPLAVASIRCSFVVVVKQHSQYRSLPLLDPALRWNVV
jgi:hypothetical protein